jgi:hypothetical protein
MNGDSAFSSFDYGNSSSNDWANTSASSNNVDANNVNGASTSAGMPSSIWNTLPPMPATASSSGLSAHGKLPQPIH